MNAESAPPATLRGWTRVAQSELGDSGPRRRVTLGAAMRAVALLCAERRGFIPAPRLEPTLRGEGSDRWRWIEDACDEADRGMRHGLFTVRAAALRPAEGRAAARLVDEAARMDLGVLEPETLGVLYESALLDERRPQGSYYTPPAVARYILRRTLASAPGGKGDIVLADGLRIIDPCCGAGLFLACAFDEAVAALPECAGAAERTALIDRMARWQLHGIDRDSEAAHLARMVLSLKAWAFLGTDEVAAGNGIATSWSWRIESRDALASDDLPRGFHLVVGNPPYLSHRAVAPPDRQRYRERGRVAGGFDVATLFTEAGLDMLAPGGALGFLVSNKFMASDYGERLRHRLLTEFELREIADLSTLPLFHRAAAYAVAIIASRPYDAPATGEVILASFGRSGGHGSIGGRAPMPEMSPAPRSVLVDRDAFRALPGGVLTPRLTPSSARLVLRLLQAGRPLPVRSIRCGVARSGFARTLLDDAARLALAPPDRDGWVPILMSGDVTPFRLRDDEARYIHRSWLGAGHRRTFDQPKLLFAGMSRGLAAAVDPGGHALGRVYYVPESEAAEPVAYLAAIFNSRVLTWCYQLLFWSVHLAGDYLRVNGTYLARLPVPRSDDAGSGSRAATARIAGLARTLTETGGHTAIETAAGLASPQAAAAAARDELESLVAEQYQLTPADRRQIDEDLGEWRGMVTNVRKPRLDGIG